MTNSFAAQARTMLSPEWDHGFDEAFTELISSDADWVSDEFDALIGANFNDPPEPPAAPAPPTGQPEPSPSLPDNAQSTLTPRNDERSAKAVTAQRSPP